MPLHIEAVTNKQFSLGKTFITQGALTYCQENNIDYLELTHRHTAGDFGIVGYLDNAQLTRAERQHGPYLTYDGLKLNAVAILDSQGIVLSIYPSPSPKGNSQLWIETLLADDKTYTTISLPSEYLETTTHIPI